MVNNLSQKISGSLPFLALECDGFSSTEVSTDGIQVWLEGDIQVNGGPLSAANGSGRQRVIDALSHEYRTRGDEFLTDLAGAFRLALWDPQKRQLLIAVDPFATRPLYYACVNGVLVFAPRISCFSALPNASTEIDPNVLYFYLNHSFIPAPFTICRHIRRLEPGHYLCWQAGSLRVRQYWNIQYDEDAGLSEDAAADLIRAAVERSVRSYLVARSCSMGEIGAFLSGGTDSSTLVGLMTKAGGTRVKTFSVGFAEERYNEIHYARVAAAHFNSEAYECFVTADDALSAIPMVAAQFDEPFGNSSAIPTYFCVQMAKDAGVKVMFAGDGGDELFAGNERYLSEKYFRPFDILPNDLQVLSRRMAAFFPQVYGLRKLRRYIERASEPNPKRFFHYQLFLSENTDNFFTEDFRSSIDRDFVLRMPEHHYRKAATADSLNRLLYMDLKMCIADNDLFKVNRMAEAVGMEVKYPYLHRYLAEITGRIPAKLKLKGFQKRYVFKKAFRELLPQEILEKQKHGFGLPVAGWLRTHAGFRELAQSLLLDSGPMQRGYFKRKALEDLLRKHDSEQSDFYGTFIWNLMMLELWHQYYRDNARDKLVQSSSGESGQPVVLPDVLAGS